MSLLNGILNVFLLVYNSIDLGKGGMKLGFNTYDAAIFGNKGAV